MVAERKPVNRLEQKRKIRKLVEKQEKKAAAQDAVKSKVRSVHSLKDRLKQATSSSEKKVILDRLKGLVISLENAVAEVKDAVKDVSEAKSDVNATAAEAGIDVAVADAGSHSDVAVAAFAPIDTAVAGHAESAVDTPKPVAGEKDVQTSAPEDALAAAVVGTAAAPEDKNKDKSSGDHADAVVDDVADITAVAAAVAKPDEAEKEIKDLTVAVATIAIVDEVIKDTIDKANTENTAKKDKAAAKEDKADAKESPVKTEDKAAAKEDKADAKETPVKTEDKAAVKEDKTKTDKVPVSTGDKVAAPVKVVPAPKAEHVTFKKENTEITPADRVAELEKIKSKIKRKVAKEAAKKDDRYTDAQKISRVTGGNGR